MLETISYVPHFAWSELQCVHEVIIIIKKNVVTIKHCLQEGGDLDI